MLNITTNRSVTSVAATGLKRAFFLFWALDFYLVWLVASFLSPPPSWNDYGFFVFIQIVLGGAWYWLHARRLHDAGYGVARALGVLAIFLLAVGLLQLIIAFAGEPERTYLFGYSIDMVWRLVAFSRGFGDPLGYLAWLACLALLIPPLFSVWCALQPKRTP